MTILQETRERRICIADENDKLPANFHIVLTTIKKSQHFNVQYHIRNCSSAKMDGKANTVDFLQHHVHITAMTTYKNSMESLHLTRQRT